MFSVILKDEKLDQFKNKHQMNCDFVILSVDEEKSAQAILEADLKMQIDFAEAILYF